MNNIKDKIDDDARLKAAGHYAAVAIGYLGDRLFQAVLIVMILLAVGERAFAEPQTNIGPQDNSNYTRIDWEDHERDVMQAFSCHRWSNDKSYGVLRIQYLHSHCTLYHPDNEGKLQHSWDFEHSRPDNKIWAHRTLILQKGFIMRTDTGGGYYRVQMNDSGEFYSTEMQWDELNWGKDETRLAEDDPNN